MNLKFSPEAQNALDIMTNSSNNLFLTGRAGTGKSTLLEHFKLISKKKIVILAPTGVAALNVGGETIHSFFNLKPNFELDEVTNKYKKPKRENLFKNLQTIVIDEISMLRADILDAIDIYLQKTRKTKEPFGGIQMIFIGDLYQLPPVVGRDDKEKFFNAYNTPFFFGSVVFTKIGLEFIELQTIYRQKNSDFIDILNNIREDKLTQKDIEKLNTRVKKEFDDSKYIYLTTTNKNAKNINEKKLKDIKSDMYTFEADIEGQVQSNQHPTETTLNIKIGSQIMFVYNDKERRWVNGSIGTIIDIDKIKSLVTIRLQNGYEVEVEPYTWEISRYILENGEFQRDIIGEFTQMPFKLAWAITIHKSQGKTFDKLVIDLEFGSFAHGQTYVAFSRATSLDGIILKRAIRSNDIKMDSMITYFLKDVQNGLGQKSLF